MSKAIQRAPVLNVPMRISAYDRINTSLIVGIVLSSATLVLLTLAWWFSSPQLSRGTITFPPPDPWIEPVEPNPNEINLFDQTSADSKPLEQAVEQVGSVVAELSVTQGLGGQGLLDGIGGQGTDLRDIGKPAGGYGWSVAQSAENIEEYQRKLDFFDIQLGLVHKTRNDIWRISDLSTKKTVASSNRKAESRSHRFQNRNNRLRQWDLRIAKGAGVDVDETLAVHFYPSELIQQMQRLLAKEAGDRLDLVKQVEFRIVGDAGNYHFVIDEIQYRDGRS